MTIEEAIGLLQYPIFKWSMDWDDGPNGLEYCDAIEMAISALRTQQEAKKNEPLTLDRLQEMNREPVWVVPTQATADWDPCWAILYDDKLWVSSNEWPGALYALYLASYEKTWLAYRRQIK